MASIFPQSQRGGASLLPHIRFADVVVIAGHRQVNTSGSKDGITDAFNRFKAGISDFRIRFQGFVDVGNSGLQACAELGSFTPAALRMVTERWSIGRRFNLESSNGASGFNTDQKMRYTPVKGNYSGSAAGFITPGGPNYRATNTPVALSIDQVGSLSGMAIIRGSRTNNRLRNGGKIPFGMQYEIEQSGVQPVFTPVAAPGGTAGPFDTILDPSLLSPPAEEFTVDFDSGEQITEFMIVDDFNVSNSLTTGGPVQVSGSMRLTLADPFAVATAPTPTAAPAGSNIAVTVPAVTSDADQLVIVRRSGSAAFEAVGVVPPTGGTWVDGFRLLPGTTYEYAVESSNAAGRFLGSTTTATAA